MIAGVLTVLVSQAARRVPWQHVQPATGQLCPDRQDGQAWYAADQAVSEGTVALVLSAPVRHRIPEHTAFQNHNTMPVVHF